MKRRDFLLAGTAITSGIALGGMSGCPQNIDIITTVEQLIQKVQAGVVQACSTLGKFVPTVDTVVAVVSGLLGTVLSNANIAQALGVVDAAIHAIAAQCPQQPAPAPTLKVTVGGKDIPVVFY